MTRSENKLGKYDDTNRKSELPSETGETQDKGAAKRHHELIGNAAILNAENQPKQLDPRDNADSIIQWLMLVPVVSLNGSKGCLTHIENIQGKAAMFNCIAAFCFSLTTQDLPTNSTVRT